MGGGYTILGLSVSPPLHYKTLSLRVEARKGKGIGGKAHVHVQGTCARYMYNRATQGATRDYPGKQGS